MFLVTLAVCVAAANAAGMNFLAIGDWGGTSDFPWTTLPEISCANGMGKKAAHVNSQFTLALGDNFYSHGIRGDVHDKRFKETYEDVFTASGLKDKPWYAIAGNHDHLGNVSAEIAYTKISKNWNYPDWWYTIQKTAPDGTTIEILMIDTCILAGQSYHDEENDIFVDARGPENPHTAAQQWKWINETLASSTADYLFVAGHYPIWSICEHGPTKILVDTLNPMLKMYNATGYMSGHDHCQEYLVDSGLHYILTGAGHECCYKPTNKDKVPAGSLKFSVDGSNHGLTIGGFASMTFDAQSFSATFHTADGKDQYTTPPISPRPKA